MTEPTQPRPRGRHSSSDAGGDAGRPASELLAAWAGTDTLQLADERDARPRRRRYAPDTDATGVEAVRGPGDAADVEITGLAATGIADAGLAAAGLDLSAFGIDRGNPRRPATPLSWTGVADARAARPVDPAPRTAEMRIGPPSVPQLHEDASTAGRPALDRRAGPAPRAPMESPTPDQVAADRFADAETDPGWRSATGRPAVPQGAGAGPRQDDAAAQPGPLAALFAAVPELSGPVTEPATVVHPVEDAAEADRHHPVDGQDDDWWEPAEARHHSADDDEPAGDERYDDEFLPDVDDERHGFFAEPATTTDRTGGLEVVVPGGRDDHGDDDGHGGGSGGGGRGRSGGRGGDGDRPRKRRRPVKVLLSLLVLAAVVAGVVLGGSTLWDRINPTAKDYAGAGTGSVDIRVNDGDSLRAIAGTLVDAHVIASTGPFTKAAKANPAATGIQPGVYTLHEKMSGRSALDLLLDPSSRKLTKVTVPEGMTVTQVLQRVADTTGLPLADLQAAAADPVALGLPAYANGLVEGFLFPATYDVEPGQTPTQILASMVSGTVRVLDSLQVPEAQRLGVITEASIVQAESGSIEDMGKVARVLDNRIADGMPLQLDTTVNYANGKGKITTTAADRANPSPYNTYVHTGLPPGAIGNPGEEAIRAVLNPTPGDWRFFVVVDPDTGDTRFAATAAEHGQNVQLFQQWLRDHPGN